MYKPQKGALIVNREKGYGEIYVYGYIGDSWSDDGVTASTFVKQLKRLDSEYDDIRVRIHSQGGNVYDGVVMFNAVRECQATTSGYIDGIAASMAMPVAFSCDKVYMSRLAKAMSHRVSGGAYGNIDDIKSTLQLMEDTENDIVSIFATRAGISEEQARERYFTNKDRWMTAKEAKDEKLIDDIYDGVTVDAPKNATPTELYNMYSAALYNQLPQSETSTIYII